MTVRTGLDRIASGEMADRVRGRRVGLLCHGASVDARLCHAREVLPAAGAKIVALFAPEHGLFGAAQDMEALEHESDALTGAPIHSLYGTMPESLVPTADMLRGIDLFVVDVQDVGARYYTFVWTAAFSLRACARAGVPVVVLDRPNPIDGVHVEGPLVEPAFGSFVGPYPVANRHGMTVGEILRLVARAENVEAALEVVALEGWSREMVFVTTGLPWVLPSPNMPTVNTALVYPGACLFEGTNLSEGRGTTRPFEIVGAPYLDGAELAAALAALSLPGVVFRPIEFRPQFHKHAAERCGGVQIHVTDRNAFRPLATGVAVVQEARRLGGEAFAWRTERYEFIDDIPAFDLLCGNARVREMIETDLPLDVITASWRPDEERFTRERKPLLLY